MLLFPALIVCFVLFSMASSQYYMPGVGHLKNGLPPTYQPAPVSNFWFSSGCTFDVCFNEKCCSWLGIPVLLWVGVACFVIILFAVFLVFKSVQLLGQMREK